MTTSLRGDQLLRNDLRDDQLDGQRDPLGVDHRFGLFGSGRAAFDTDLCDRYAFATLPVVSGRSDDPVHHRLADHDDDIHLRRDFDQELHQGRELHGDGGHSSQCPGHHDKSREPDDLQRILRRDESAVAAEPQWRGLDEHLGRDVQQLHLA